MDNGRALTWEQQLVRLQSTSDADPWVVLRSHLNYRTSDADPWVVRS